VRYLLRWIANSIAFFLALYLVDSLIAPRFWVRSWWIAVILAVLLSTLDSLVPPLHRLKTRPQRALTTAVATFVMNALVLQIFIWIGAPLSTTSIVWVLVVAAFVSLLGGVLNWLIGFKKKERPGAVTRERTRKVGTPRPRS
jgi:putative membrane protein